MNLTPPVVPPAGSPINYNKQLEDYKKTVINTGNEILEDMGVKGLTKDTAEIGGEVAEKTKEATKTGFFKKMGATIKDGAERALNFVKGHKVASAIVGGIAALAVAFGVYSKVQSNKAEAAVVAEMEAGAAPEVAPEEAAAV